MTAPLPTRELLGRQLNDVEQRFAPSDLYARGDRNLVSIGVRVAIVGSRNASEEGLRRARRLARDLANKSIVVVSGLARGVDRAAHEAAMGNTGGRTVAIIGTGLDGFYPPEHRHLQERIAREHLVVSQFPPGTPPRRGNFPQRNRTMALLSDATVIVEAGRKSGVESQGWEALRLGRPLFLMRSLVERRDEILWVARLLDYGALILHSPEDLQEVLPPSSATAVAL